MAHITVKSAASGIRLVAECLSETRKLLMGESARFSHKATDTGPRLSRGDGSLPAQGLDLHCKENLSCYRPPNWCIAQCSGEAGGEMQSKLRPNPPQSTGEMQCCATQQNWLSPCAADEEKWLLNNMSNFWEELRNAKRQWSPKYHSNCNRKVY